MYKHDVNVSMIDQELIKLNLLLKFDIDPQNNNKNGLIFSNRLIKGETFYRLSLLENEISIPVRDYKNKKELFCSIQSLYSFFKLYDNRFKC